MSPRFVEVPAEAIRSRLAAAGFKLDKSNGSPEEVWIRAHDKDPNYIIKVYTSIGGGQAVARDCGQDAIRIVALTYNPYKFPSTLMPIFKATRVFRTAPKDMKQADRVSHVCERMIERCREAYAAINEARLKKGANK